MVIEEYICPVCHRFLYRNRCLTPGCDPFGDAPIPPEKEFEGIEVVDEEPDACGDEQLLAIIHHLSQFQAEERSLRF